MLVTCIHLQRMPCTSLCPAFQRRNVKVSRRYSGIPQHSQVRHHAMRWRFELEEQWINGVVSFLVLCMSLEKTWRYCKTKIGYRGKEVARQDQLCPTSGGNGFLDPELVLLPSSWKLSDKIQRAGSGCDLENRYEKDGSIYHLLDSLCLVHSKLPRKMY